MRKMQQNGYITKHRGWWVLRVRERVGVGGQIKSVHRAHRLAPVDAEHKTAKSVRGLAEQLLAPLNKNSASPLNITKLGDFCEQIYFPHVKDSKRPSTLCGYRRIWNGYVKPRYESAWMREVRTRDVQAWLEEIAREHKLSKTTLRHVKHFLSGVFRYAAQQDYLDSGRNPVTLASIPNFAPNGEEGKAYSLEEIGRMLKVLPEPANTIVACAAYTGLRLGELRGLTWEAYSPATEEDSLGSLFVTRSVWRSVIGEPKTQKSKAPVPVVPQLAEKLDEFRQSNGNPLNGPIFANSLGRPLDLEALYRRQMQDVLKRAEIQWVGWHGFRRGLASNLNRLAVDDSVIQAILRHSTISITQACYIKTARPDAVAAMRRLSEVLRSSNCAPDCAPNKERRIPAVVQ